MVRALAIAAVVLLLGTTAALAQYPAAPVPLYPGAAPRSFEPEPLRRLRRTAELPGSPRPTVAPQAAPGPAGSLTPPPEPEATARVFCQQPVTVRHRRFRFGAAALSADFSASGATPPGRRSSAPR